MSETIFTGFREGESPAPIISMDVDTGEISGPAWDCYQACAAINSDDPVKVAEALPELVEAAEEALKDYCVLQGNIAASMKVDPNWEGMWDELSKRKKALRSVLSKLKAQP